jgi:hypothetical protein
MIREASLRSGGLVRLLAESEREAGNEKPNCYVGGSGLFGRGLLGAVFLSHGPDPNILS